MTLVEDPTDLHIRVSVLSRNFSQPAMRRYEVGGARATGLISSPLVRESPLAKSVTW